MFLVSSSTSLSTISTSTYCYATNTAVTAACGKRRKRAIKYMEEEEKDVSPSNVHELESGEMDPTTGRFPRFVMYWMTTTSTSYTTSFTATTTLSKLECTPSGFTISAC